MITLGSERWTSSSPKITLTFEYEKQRSGSSMQYRAKVTVSTVTGGSYFGYPIYLKLSIGGELRETVTLKLASPSRWSDAITYTSPWYTVANKTTGTTPISFNVYSGSGADRSDTYSYEMGVDAAASEIVASGGTLGTPLTLTINRYNANFADTITYTCGTARGTVVSDSKSPSVTWGTNNGNTVALSSQNTKGQSVDVTFAITTYDGSSVVDTTYKTVTMAIPASVAPSVSLAVEDAAGYLALYGAYIQGYSKLKITATPTLAYDSPITTYAITADGATYSTNPVTTPAILGKNTLRITAKVTDDRKRSGEATPVDITVLEYARPSVTLTAQRCDSEGNINSEGSYMKIALSVTITSLNDNNSASYKITYIDDGGITQTISGTGLSYVSQPIPCDASRTKDVSVTVRDRLSGTPQSVTVPIAYTLMDFHSSGKGVAFGKVGTREGFDCAMPALFNGNPVKEVGSPIDNTDAVNLEYLLVNFAVAKEDATHPGCYYRTVDGAKEWVNPPMILGEEYRTTERWNGYPVYVKLIDFDALPNTGIKVVAFADNDSNCRGVRASFYAQGPGGNVTLPVNYEGRCYTFYISNNHVVVETNADISKFHGYCMVWFIKA